MKRLILVVLLTACSAKEILPKVPVVYIPKSDRIYPKYSEKLLRKIRAAEDKARKPKSKPKKEIDDDISISEYLMLHWKE